MTKIIQIFKIPDLRKKILMVVFLLFVFRLLAAIPIPGIDAAKLNEFFSSNQLFGFLNIFSGGGLSNLSVMMLGVGPYITATIIMQLLTIIFPQLKKAYYEEGAEGRIKFNRYSRYLTVPLAGLQAYGFLNLLISRQVLEHLSPVTMLSNILIITAGSLLLTWIGELISEYKIGNGISLIIFAGIVSRLPQDVISSILSYTPTALPTYAAFIILAIVVVTGVTFINEGERKIPISYAKQVRGNKLYGGVSTYLPLRVNQAGVIPIIFALSFLLFPQFLAQAISAVSPNLSLYLNELVSKFFNNVPIYSLIYFVLVVVFTYFYTAITFDPKEISKNLQQSGGFIPGVRPGRGTAQIIQHIVNRITLSGAIFLGAIAILPYLTQMITGIQALTIGGTALLIVVAVALEVMKQIESQLTIREYEGII
ncbi:preprotein translocase subunit SecY [Candidatus Jorgensenbacteria bacterium CG_4_10_14_0_8_um_filter_39_13]|uniref:Protein translocase subunit SecY n=2 Tax=Candidatus Joergenseniibacteriota TaxID=1752739 RepID=A0A2M7RI20_9BACT|nr:MAG: preprotein translocase subunit SecY [Candidatus Jorgensenbacteria bacterium CG11_big_fil_rev_8_21_14_0_20_38_23]PIV13189.1 MAG: preprotein translocase subunit SecY [Candidatus Jorgensenbacteria bacterium CG03_land_8_20_14_0_80_38_39]PIW97598.1 MAG: preprotein translocase subunit SecY [Candidatus Jorgensenbacteria bacterium CG_4_8_14_3_um_filter_38_10]PIY96026.1 MAG: preprotein translocase subunit SecY [Candidatus Jorgensenbacteria bacterium CG_4_10_14_0_8_um_filter_39_13]